MIAFATFTPNNDNDIWFSYTTANLRAAFMNKFLLLQLSSLTDKLPWQVQYQLVSYLYTHYRWLLVTVTSFHLRWPLCGFTSWSIFGWSCSNQCFQWKHMAPATRLFIFKWDVNCKIWKTEACYTGHLNTANLLPVQMIMMVTNQNICIKHYIYPNITAQDAVFSMDQRWSAFNGQHTKLCIKT